MLTHSRVPPRLIRKSPCFRRAFLLMRLWLSNTKWRKRTSPLPPFVLDRALFLNMFHPLVYDGFDVVVVEGVEDGFAFSAVFYKFALL